MQKRKITFLIVFASISSKLSQNVTVKVTAFHGNCLTVKFVSSNHCMICMHLYFQLSKSKKGKEYIEVIVKEGVSQCIYFEYPPFNND